MRQQRVATKLAKASSLQKCATNTDTLPWVACSESEAGFITLNSQGGGDVASLLMAGAVRTGDVMGGPGWKPAALM